MSDGPWLINDPMLAAVASPVEESERNQVITMLPGALICIPGQRGYWQFVRVNGNSEIMFMRLGNPYANEYKSAKFR